MKEKDELSNLIEDINYFVSGNKESFVFISSISDFFNKSRYKKELSIDYV